MARPKPLLKTWPAVAMLIFVFVFARLFGAAFSAFISPDAAPAQVYLIVILQQVLCYGLPAFLYMSQARGIRTPTPLQNRKPDMRLIRLSVLLAVLNQLALQLLSGLFSMWLSGVGIAPLPPGIPMPRTYSDALLVLPAVAVVPAICEECLFRGAVFPSVRREFSDASAVFITALLFAFMHGNLAPLPAHLFAGLMITFLYFETQSLMLACSYHFVFNLVSYLTDALPQLSALRGAILTSPLLTLAIIFLLMVIALFVLIKGFRPKREWLSRTPSLSAVGLVILAFLCFLPRYLLSLFPV